MCAGFIGALLAFEPGQLIARLLDLALELGSRADRGLALRGGGAPDCIGVGARLVEVGARGLGVGTRALHLGPRGVRVGPSALHFGPGGVGIVAQALPNQLERALELLGPFSLAGQRPIELAGAFGQLRLGVPALTVGTGGLERAL